VGTLPHPGCQNRSAPSLTQRPFSALPQDSLRKTLFLMKTLKSRPTVSCLAPPCYLLLERTSARDSSSLLSGLT
jgi:hypothetical protein